MRSTLAAAAATIVAVLASTAPAVADSLVYVRDHNVWLANPDGSGQYQVTTDGSAGQPYGSPSQADDGTIAVSYGNYVKLLRQNGSVIRELDAPALTNTYSHVVDGRPAHVAISPDGARIAYSFVSFEGGGGTQAAQATTGFLDAAGAQLAGNLYNGYPAWVTNARLLTSGGYGWHVNLHDVGQQVEARWLNDSQGDLSDPEVNRQGTRLALVRREGNAVTLVTYDTAGDVLAGTPAKTATARCALGPQDGLASPTWAPDGNALAWAEPDGIWTMAQAGTCTGDQPRLTIAGASEPDWGPAPVNPGPRETPPDTRRETPPDTRRETPPDTRRETPQRRSPGARPSVASPRTPAKLAARGLRITYRCATACTVSVTATPDAATAQALRLRRGGKLLSGSRHLRRAGAVTLTVTPDRTVKARLAGLRTATVTVHVTVKLAGATRSTRFTQRVRVRR